LSYSLLFQSAILYGSCMWATVEYGQDSDDHMSRERALKVRYVDVDVMKIKNMLLFKILVRCGTVMKSNGFLYRNFHGTEAYKIYSSTMWGGTANSFNSFSTSLFSSRHLVEIY
jgi:hypothetical protein